MTYHVKWAHKGLCVGLPTDLFFESYENSAALSHQIDTMCKECPIQRECLAVGVSRKEWGVWGGIYLQDGDISQEYNKHKTNADWGDMWLALTTGRRSINE